MTPLAGLDEFRKDQTPADWRPWCGIQIHLKRAATNRPLFGRRRAAENDSHGIYR